METKAYLSVILFVAGVFAEPPVRNYLPPNAGGNGGYPSGPSGPGGYPSGPSGPGGFPGSGSPAPGGYPGSSGGNQGGNDGPSEPANYEFSYEVKDAASGNDFGHSESRQGDVAKGKYYVLLPDGRKQVVEYTADLEGYKPKITYEGEANTGGAPGGGYPSSPSGGYPSSPSGGYPTTPSGGYPSSPSGGYPGSQNGGYPSPAGGNANGGYRY